MPAAASPSVEPANVQPAHELETPLPPNVQPLAHEQSRERLKFAIINIDPGTSGSKWRSSSRFRFDDVLSVMATDIGVDPSVVGTVDLTGVIGYYEPNSEEPSMLLLPGVVLKFMIDKAQAIGAVSRLFFPACRKSRPHMLLRVITAEGLLSEPAVWAVRRVTEKMIANVLGHLDRTTVVWKELKEAKETGVDAKVIAGDLALDATRQIADNTAKGKGITDTDTSDSGRGRRKRRKITRLTFERPTVQTRTPKDKDTDDDSTDSDPGVDQYCFACEGWFDLSKKDDRIRYKCSVCSPSVLLCQVCVLDHRAANKTHRCRKIVKAKPTTKRTRTRGRGGSGEKKAGGDAGPAKSPSTQHHATPTLSDEALVKAFETRRALYAPEQASADKTRLLEAQERELELAIRVARLQGELQRAKAEA